MRSRQTLTEIFSTFLQWFEDQPGPWAVDARLRRHMQQRLTQAQPGTEAFWALYWQKEWQQQSPVQPWAEQHLSAYLQETCYWATRKIVAPLNLPQTPLADCFQVAITTLPKILAACDPNQPASLKTYASQAFSNTIRNHLRQRREVDLCSNWGLLLKLSRKQMLESLHHAGVPSAQLESYLLAWKCFSSAYVPAAGLRKLPGPDAKTWATIVTTYNQHAKTIEPALPNETVATLEHWLLTCANYARSFLYPGVLSLNAPKSGDSSGEWQDDLANEAADSLLSDLIVAEEIQLREQQQMQISEVLQTALKDLDVTAQDLLRLYYQEGLKQQALAQRLEIQQYAVSRKLAKAREQLLRSLTIWSQETLHISPTSDVVKGMNTALEEWLQAHFQGPATHT
jgi:RNA polymerase sigma factor (sigma-70 family)